MGDPLLQLTGLDSARFDELRAIVKRHSEMMRDLGLAGRLSELSALRTSLPVGLEAVLSKAGTLEEQLAPFQGAMKAIDALKPSLTPFEGLSMASGFAPTTKVAEMLSPLSKIQDHLGSAPKIADFLQSYNKASDAFEGLALYRTPHDFALGMDLIARNLITSQQSALNASGIMDSINALRPLEFPTTTEWGLPEWRPAFEQVANVSLALDIGSWSGRRRAERDEERFVDLRRTQADEDRRLLDALIDEFMPSLRPGIDGAREVLMRRSADYRTQFAASARKAIDLAARTLAPQTTVSRWVDSDPSRARKRNKKGELLITFNDQLSFMFRDAAQGAREFFVLNSRTIVRLRSNLSDLNHVNSSDPHLELVESMQLVERLLLHILLEVQRKASS